MRGYPDRSGNLSAELKQLDQYHAPDIITQYNASADKRTFRDEVVNARLRAIDLYFGIFQQEVSKEKIGTEVATDWAVIALSGGGAVLPSAGTKTVLAAISGGLTGAKGSIYKNIFYDKTLTAMLSKMESLRKVELVKIRTGLQMDVTRYPLTQALIDLEDYYKAGTLPGAIMGVTAEAGEKHSSAEQDLKKILVTKYQRDQAGEILRRLWKPDGTTIDDTGKQRLESWMKANGLENVSITSFLRGALFEEARARAVKELNLNE